MTPQEQLTFLSRVWGEAQGYVEFEQKRKDSEGNRTGDPTDNKNFLWPTERERIGRYLSLRTEEDLYFAVPLYSKPSRKALDAKLISSIYVDDDGVTGEYRLPPSISVESSPGHFHHYWVLDEPADPIITGRIGAEISAYHRHDNEHHADMVADHKHCGTDPGGWDITQILRVPGTLNKKPEYGPGFEHRIPVIDHGTTYTLEQLEAAYPKTALEYVSVHLDSELPSDMPDHVDLLAQLSGRPDLVDLFVNEPTGRGNAQGWDERLFAFENELFRMGFSEREVYSLAWHAACNKFKRGVRQSDGITFKPRPNPQLDLWRDVLKAGQTHANRESSWQAPEYNRDAATMELDEHGDAVRVYESVRERLVVSILTDKERQVVAESPTIVDEYVEWAASKTDAARVYHVAGIFTVLSVVFGEFGHAFPKFGKLRLNLWFLVLGVTTRARKSTSRGLMIKLLDGLSTPDYEYDEGGDFTSEALLERLSEKPRQSSLIHRDEVQGMFNDIHTKGYMSNLSDTLTELYDGKVRSVMRRGQERTNAQETNFVMFLMGIVSKVTSVLTLDDFATGFLARFMYVIGEAPTRTKESEWLDQASPEQMAGGDPVYLKLVSKLMRARTLWQKRVPDRHTTPIYFNDDAWFRWNEANWDLSQSILHHDRADILESAVDRMGKSAIKAATLLAMVEGKDRVELKHVLIALHYTEGWTEDMVRAAEMVSESFWKKDMHTLHDIIMKRGGAIRWEDAYSKMDKKPGEFQQLVEGVVLSNMARVKIDEKTKTRWLEAL